MWSKLNYLFMKILPEIKSAMPILIVAIFVLINVGIWWAGPWLVVDEQQPLTSVMARAITSTIFSLSCFTFWGWLQWRKLKHYNLENEQSQQLKEDPIKGLVERQEVELNDVMSGLKDSLNTRNYLYALPWYLVLGVENAGKTSLINRSGQKFVFSSVMRASGKKTENPYSFDWWISDDAVLIDPDGELLTQKTVEGTNEGEMARRLWTHFVGWLENTRSRRPLNGVVLALDMASMISSATSERKAYAQLLRARLRELMETLSTRLPVYITLTKLDLLLGFEPFFRHYTQAQRDEIMGFTFSLNSVNDLDSWLAEFDADYRGFIERINAQLPRALLQCRDKEERTAIYSFTRQIAGSHQVLQEFLGDALASDQFSTSALVRGVYFSSVYQQGVPTNAYVDSASRRYGLRESINSAQKSDNSTPYFIHTLFHKIIYPEAGLASDNFKVAKQKRRLMMLSFVACSIASVLLVGTWHRYYLLNSHQADAVLNKVTAFNELNEVSSFDVLGKSIIPPLNTIRTATLEFGFFRDKPKFISDFGLYQGHTIGPKVEETYLKLLSYRYLPALLKQVATDMSRAPNKSNEKLAMLRVFRMMVDKSGRHDDFVKSYFTQVWQKSYEGDRILQTQLMEHLDYALLHTDLQSLRDAGAFEAEAKLKPYDSLIAQTQQELSSLPIEQRVYRQLKQSASSALGTSLDLKLATGPAYELVFAQRDAGKATLDPMKIPRLLSKQGFERYFIPKSDSIADLALIDSWVLGQSESTDFSQADKVALRNKIINQYILDYKSSWRKALNGFELQDFNDINHGVLVIDNFAISNRPINRILDSLTKNTELFPSMPDDLSAQKAILDSPQYQIAAKIDADFTGLNQLQKTDGNQPVYLDEVMDSIGRLHGYLKSIQDAPDVGKAALKAAQDRLTLSDTDPIYALARISASLPKPMDTMVGKMASESWKVILQSAIKHLEVRWYNEVFQEYQQNLASRYPFNPASTKQVSIDDFQRFFGPEGTLNTFYNDQMKMFLEENFDALNQFSQGNSNLVRNEVLASLKQAKQIQQAFFNPKGNLDVEFSLEALKMSANKRRSVMNIDGQFVEYTHGPQRGINLIWPNTLRKSALSKLTLVPTETEASPRSVEFEGPWAFFRLLDSAKMSGSSSTSVDYQFEVDKGDVTYRLRTRDNVNPFTTKLLSGFKIPKTLY
ncbi:type VI secretion system membrane subunit TssM [Shewanella sp. VB17]|uniref:type VI secretion system membrane subunit TssM n=1 Tax=Shewanella sp. VB17 TaxID=2739432 RepID=UPI001564A22C|nr:type VI secretion system membrane subunit TssM [Shewanella sp. VB17]NRD73749.1 type VI secretion system membrane subunit TssM [Shewanella sp. VB17]